MHDDREDQCRYVANGNDRILIPGCMGAAVYGESGCTCDPIAGSNADLRERVEDMEARLKQWRSICAGQTKRINELQRRLVALEDLVRREGPRPIITVDPE